MSRVRLNITRLCATSLLVAALGAGVVACGGDQGAPATGTTGTMPPTTTPAPAPASTVPADPAAARRLDAAQRELIDAYAPVTGGHTTVWGAQVLFEQRLGSSRDVAREARAYARVLERSRTAIVSIEPAAGVRDLRRHLLAAIDARLGAVRALMRYHALVQRDSDAAGRFSLDRATWVRQHDLSMRHARLATNDLQERRADAGLEPAREDSIR